MLDLEEPGLDQLRYQRRLRGRAAAPDKTGLVLFFFLRSSCRRVSLLLSPGSISTSDCWLVLKQHAGPLEANLLALFS